MHKVPITLVMAIMRYGNSWPRLNMYCFTVFYFKNRLFWKFTMFFFLILNPIFLWLTVNNRLFCLLGSNYCSHWLLLKWEFVGETRDDTLVSMTRYGFEYEKHNSVDLSEQPDRRPCRLHMENRSLSVFDEWRQAFWKQMSWSYTPENHR